MATNAFLKIEGIPGESPQTGHENEIELIDFVFSLEQRTTASKAGGVGAGAADFKGLTVTKFIDKASPLLFMYCSSGKHVSKATLTLAKSTGATGTSSVYTTITLTEFMVAKYELSGDEDGGAKETLTIAFSKIEFDYKAQKQDGSLGPSTKHGWDVKANKAA